MFRRLALNVLGTPLRPYSSTKTTSSKGKWNLVSSVCLQRKPTISKPITEFEEKVQKLLFQLEIESSWKNDWELEIEKDLKDLEQIKSGDISKVGRKLCKDWEDEWKAELNNFKLAPRLTDADKKKDVKSWNRLLDSTLVLVVQEENKGNRWILPNGKHAEGETMRQSAERVLQESCGEDLKVQFYGNAPCGFFKYKYPREVRDKTGIDGDKVFFYKAYLIEGNIKSESIKDFQWVAQNELNALLSPDYCRSVQMFLFDEK